MKKNIFPPTTKKVAINTCDEINTEIRNRTIECINTYKDCSREILNDKIQKLNCEWDTERIVETKAGALILMGSLLGLSRRRSRLFLFTGTIGFFLLQHALEGWCPHLPIIRSMGIRTAEEINNEKTVLKMIRGDFIQDTNDVNEIFNMTEK